MTDNNTVRQTAKTDSLRKGDVLTNDAYDNDGNRLLTSGSVVTAEFLAKLVTLGIREVYLRTPRYQRDSALILPYDLRAEQQLASAFQQTTATISDLVQQLQSGHATRTQDVEELVVPVWEQSVKDSAVVLACCMAGKPLSTQWDRDLADRSTRMSMLSIVTAVQMGMSEANCIAAGIVAAIHDVSLYGRPNVWQLDDYVEHPNWSLDLLQNTYGLTDEMKVMIGQVHEQSDGSGYPQKLKSVRLHPVSRVLNVVDAFLNLVEPIEAGKVAYSPADVMAYLVQHSMYGCFDRDCVRALLLASGAYPVGTQVELDDGQIATVLRSTGAAYTTPVVKIGEAIEDLRFSNRTIVRPLDVNLPAQRLPKSALEQVLWQVAVA
jgi:HD-GYP domain-containing protein (c-di-GMP phosphodiesterase class II)